jgi:alpha/beta superfamily hydrolase
MEIFYFGPPSRRLFGVLDCPETKARVGLVFCPPFGEEMITTYARLALWGKALVRKGFAVLRFHPYGTGESDGSFKDFSIDGALRDTQTAIDCLHERVNVQRTGLFGLRFGAFLAVQAALASSIDLMLVWSPVTDLRPYCRELLRSRLTAELVHLKAERVRVTTRDMIAEFEAGKNVDILGYEFSPSLYRQMNESLAWPAQPTSPKALWLSRISERPQLASIPDDWTREEGDARLRFLPEIPFWEEFSSVFPAKFAGASEEWLAAFAGRHSQAPAF